MPSEYTKERNGGYYVAGTRISLDSVVCAFKRGDSPERILERYPLLGKPARVYGATAFYLDHQAEIDAYLEAGSVSWRRRLAIDCRKLIPHSGTGCSKPAPRWVSRGLDPLPSRR